MVQPFEPAVGFGGGTRPVPGPPAFSQVAVAEVPVQPSPLVPVTVAQAGSLHTIIENIGVVPVTLSPRVDVQPGAGYVLEPGEVFETSANAALYGIAPAAFNGFYVATSGLVRVESETTIVDAP